MPNLHPLIPDNEVTNGIGDLLTKYYNVNVFTDFFIMQLYHAALSKSTSLKANIAFRAAGKPA